MDTESSNILLINFDGWLYTCHYVPVTLSLIKILTGSILTIKSKNVNNFVLYSIHKEQNIPKHIFGDY